MLQSIKDDIKRTFQSGNMVSKIVVANIFVFVVVALLEVFLKPFDGIYEAILRNLQISSDPLKVLFKPWTLLTHMFLHVTFWHILWNMLLLYWFGRIVGDLLGDKKVLPIYVYGGLVGAVVFMLYVNLLGNGVAPAHGASAGVMAIIIVAALTAPDYNMRLLFIGDVKIKYIALALIVMDIIGTGKDINTGGHFAHLGGLFFGWFYLQTLRSGKDLAVGFNNRVDGVKNLFTKEKPAPKPKSPLKVKYKAKNFTRSKGSRKSDNTNIPFQEKLDSILEKIKAKGYDNLTDEEKEFLFQASKK